jgi:hypothetical protein
MVIHFQQFFVLVFKVSVIFLNTKLYYKVMARDIGFVTLVIIAILFFMALFVFLVLSFRQTPPLQSVATPVVQPQVSELQPAIKHEVKPTINKTIAVSSVETPVHPCLEQVKQAEQRFKGSERSFEAADEDVIEQGDRVRNANDDLIAATNRDQPSDELDFLRGNINQERKLLYEAIARRDATRDAKDSARKDYNRILRECSAFAQ